jgi:type IV pilus assembly protein PilV
MNSDIKYNRSRVQSGGFTLIETLVALLVLSVGLIGVAALHGQALAASGLALNRSQATVLAGEISDRIRGNRSAGTAYEAAAGDNGCDEPTASGGGDCSPAEMAAHDLFLWQDQIARNLPGGRGAIDVDTTSIPTRYTVTVSWDEPSSEDPVSFTFDFSLPDF